MFFQPQTKLILFFILIAIVSCKEKSIIGNVSTSREWKSELTEYEKLLNTDPSFNNFQIGMLKISQLLVDTNFQDNRKDILLKGIEWCKKMNDGFYSLVYKKEYVKSFPQDAKSEQYLFDITKTLDEDQQELEVKIMYDGILKRWPQNKEAKENWLRIKRDVSEFDFFLNETGKKMFGTPEQFRPDSARVAQFISFSETFAYAYPDDKRTVKLLMTGAQTAKTGMVPGKAIELYDWVWRYYPKSEDAAMALFLKGFTYETDLNNKEFAIDAYKTFLYKYPGHPQTKEVAFLLENINTPQKELLKKLEN
ncbi:MAG: tetratricopeptide repeat protein [Saprospiraceae bacterium]|nr:tetratricopeptide repeat protein [Saprospiraceae bacterium]